MLSLRSFPGAGRLIAALLLILALGSTAGDAGAEEAGRELQLEVIVNGTPTNLIGSFTMLEGKRIAARRAELEEIGLNP